jgi:hypothetical protein
LDADNRGLHAEVNPVRNSHGALNPVFTKIKPHSSPRQGAGRSASNGVKIIRDISYDFFILRLCQYTGILRSFGNARPCRCRELLSPDYKAEMISLNAAESFPTFAVISNSPASFIGCSSWMYSGLRSMWSCLRSSSAISSLCIPLKR